jgi:hypothetical protein
MIANFRATQRDSIVRKIAAMDAQKAANENKVIGSRAAPDRDVGMKSPSRDLLFYFGCPVEPFSLPTPVSDDVGAERVSGAGFAGW